MHRSKEIYVNEQGTKYVKVFVYSTKLEMQAAYKKFSPQDGNHNKVKGAHCAYNKYIIPKGGKRKYLSHETGTIFLCYPSCGAGVISHEFLHAVLWAHQHTKTKKQYPVVIKDMKQEETICYSLTRCVKEFYNWLYRIEKIFKNN